MVALETPASSAISSRVMRPYPRRGSSLSAEAISERGRSSGSRCQRGRSAAAEDRSIAPSMHLTGGQLQREPQTRTEANLDQGEKSLDFLIPFAEWLTRWVTCSVAAQRREWIDHRGAPRGDP